TPGKSVELVTSLKQLINNLVNNSLPTAMHNKSIVVNGVAHELTLGAGMSLISTIMHDLLTTVLVNSRNGDIHITADRYHDVVTIDIQERNNNNGYALAYSIGSIE